jgi:hypothetical protein
MANHKAVDIAIAHADRPSARRGVEFRQRLNTVSERDRVRTKRILHEM